MTQEILPPVPAGVADNGAADDGNGKQWFNGRPGPGRPKGSANKTSAALKTMILNALNNVGGEAYLTYQAMVAPQLFMPLVGKVLAVEKPGDAEGGENIQYRYIKRIPMPKPKPNGG